MTKLTDTQRAVLTAAAGRADGAIQPLPDKLKGGAVTKVLHALLSAELITQAPYTITPTGRAAIADDGKASKPVIPAALEKLTVTQIATAIANITGEPVNPKSFNYKDKALERLAAAMTDRQLSIQAVLTAAGIEAIAPDGTALSGLGLKPNAESAPETKIEPPPPPRKTRADSKQAQLIEMLKRPQGASAEEIAVQFGWQPHTVRGAIAGALKKKLGLTVMSEKVDGRGRVYRIAPPSPHPQG
jgi:hypothetical protein